MIHGRSLAPPNLGDGPVVIRSSVYSAGFSLTTARPAQDASGRSVLAARLTASRKAALVASSLIFGAQPGLSAVIAGRARQVVGARNMPFVWRRMVLSVGISQTVAGYALVALFNATGSYTPVFLIGGGAMALGAVLSLRVWERKSG